MSNLGQGIWDKALEVGIQQGRTEGREEGREKEAQSAAIEMFRTHNMPIGLIAQILKRGEDVIRGWVIS